MTASPYWNGVRMRTTQVTADPDDPIIQPVTLPAAWEDEAASALLLLASPADRTDGAPLQLATEAMRWLTEIESLTGLKNATRGLACLLLMRQLAPTAPLWLGQRDRRPGFVVNLAAFVFDGAFAGDAFLAAIRLACDVLRKLHTAMADMLNAELPLFDLPPLNAAPSGKGETAPLGDGPAGMLLLTNLDACLAQIGLDYDSETGRDAACTLVWIATALARQGSGPVPLPPATCPAADLAALAAQIRDEAASFDMIERRAAVETAFSASGPVDALLGVEACGLAPIFSPLQADGTLRPSTLARLAHRGYTPETALAAALAGETPLRLPGPDAQLAMHRALAGFVDRMPARPNPIARPVPRAGLERGVRRPLPARHTGFTQRASVGGHKLFLRTGEYEDGTLGEVAIIPVRESAMVRGLLDSIGQAVSIGLQYGAPLEDYIARFAHTRFGPGGTVEGDPVAAYATSLLDYAFRALSDAYLGRRLPDAAPEAAGELGTDPLLPLGMPEVPRRPPGLRLVG